MQIKLARRAGAVNPVSRATGLEGPTAAGAGGRAGVGPGTRQQRGQPLPVSAPVAALKRRPAGRVADEIAAVQLHELATPGAARRISASPEQARAHPFGLVEQ